MESQQCQDQASGNISQVVKNTVLIRKLLILMLIFCFIRERELALTKQKATQQFIEDFKHARDQWKELERQRMEEENKRILEFAHVQQQREAARMSQKKAKEDSMAKVQQAVNI